MNKKETYTKSRAVIRILVTLKKSWETPGEITNQICVIKTSNHTDKLHGKTSNKNITSMKQESPYSKPNKIGKPVQQSKARKIIIAKSPRGKDNYTATFNRTPKVAFEREINNDCRNQEKIDNKIIIATDNKIISEQKKLDPIASGVAVKTRRSPEIDTKAQDLSQQSSPNNELGMANNILKQEELDPQKNSNRVVRIKITKRGPTTLLKENENLENDENPFDEFLASERSQINGVKRRIDDFAMEKILGQGSYAIVKLARDRRTNQKYAIKTYQRFKLYDTQRRKNVRLEISLLRNLDHPNIIKLYDIIANTTHINLVMELGGQQSLYDYLKTKQNRKLSENEARKIFKQLVDGTKYLHEKNIIHRDLKLENALIDEEKNIKIIDFGFSVAVKKDELLRNFCGTPSYMAPEIVNRKEYNGIFADVWALGIILYILLSGKLPFKAEHDRELYNKITRCSYERITDVSAEAQKLISRILKVNPKERMTTSQILEDNWIKGNQECSKEAENSISEKLCDAKSNDKHSETSEADTDITRTH